MNNCYVPYTYLIGWSKLNTWYYGVRFAKGCHPDDLWRTHFTSSKRVSAFRKEQGEPDIIEIRKTFETSDQARIWEERVLKCINIKDGKWLNANVAGAIDSLKAVSTEIQNGSTNKGRKFPNRKPYSQETKEKFKGTKSEEHKQNMLKPKINRENYKGPKSEEHKHKLRKPKTRRYKYTEEEKAIKYASRKGKRGPQKNPDPNRHRKRGPGANLKGWETRRKKKKMKPSKITINRSNTLILFQFVEKHGKILYDMLSKEAVDRNVYFISGDVKATIREDIRRQIEEEQNGIIVASYQTTSTGVNIKNLANVIFASPSKSKIRNLQSIGRGLRTTETKTSATLYDIADDLSWKSHKNYTLLHFAERLKIYNSEKFRYKIYHIDL